MNNIALRTIAHNRARALNCQAKIFKVWKSHFRITQVPKGSPEQLRVIIYARPIILTVMIQFCTQR